MNPRNGGRSGGDARGEEVPAFRDVFRMGHALVVATPRVPAPRVSSEVRTVALNASRKGLRARFFGVSVPALRRAGLSVVPVGREPLWRPEGWLERTARRGSLREQVRRARAKGVRVRCCDRSELPASVHALAVRWLESRGMAPMGFSVRLRLGGGEGALWVAMREGEVVAAAQVRPAPEWEGWLVEHLLRDPKRAPNGWAELLLQHVAMAAREHGVPWISLGLAPLEGPGVPAWMRWAGRLGSPLFDFEGLAAFKARLRPDRWVRRGLGHAPGELPFRAVEDVLRAFAGGSLWRFGWATLRHRGWLPGEGAPPPLPPVGSDAEETHGQVPCGRMRVP